MGVTFQIVQFLAFGGAMKINVSLQTDKIYRHYVRITVLPVGGQSADIGQRENTLNFFRVSYFGVFTSHYRISFPFGSLEEKLRIVAGCPQTGPLFASPILYEKSKCDYHISQLPVNGNQTFEYFELIFLFLYSLLLPVS
jgi:hypothetical protein